MATAGQIQSERKQWRETSQNNNKLVGVAILLTQLGTLFAYGFVGRFYEQPVPRVAYQGIFYTMMMMIFTILGFGLILNVYKFGTWLGTGTAIIVAALNIQFSPLMQQFWFSVFISGFTNEPTTAQVGENLRVWWAHYIGEHISPSYLMQQTSMLSSISLLVAFTAFIGRVNLAQIIKITLFFTFFWNMTYFCLIRVYTIIADFNDSVDSAEFSPRFFDYFGASYVYLFGAFFGLVYSLMLVKQKFPLIHPSNEYNRISVVLSGVGTAFIFATFIFTSNNFITYPSGGRSISTLAIIFSLTGSVLGTYVGSALAGKGKVGYKEALVGTISGGVSLASVAPILQNIGIIILIGFIVALFCGIYMRTLHLKINKNYTYDALGLFGPFLISSLFGSMLVPASLISYYYNFQVFVPTYGSIILHSTYAGWQLAAVGISAGAGIVSALFLGIISLCERDLYGLGSNSRYFANEFGLYTPGDELIYTDQDKRSDSAKQLDS